MPFLGLAARSIFTHRRTYTHGSDLQDGSAVLNLQSIVKTYDRYAPLYDIVFGMTLHHGRRVLASRLQTESGESLLEIGVGSGLMLPLYPSHLKVLGVDISERMLSSASAVVEKHQLQHVQLKLLNAELGDLPPASFDHVVLPYVYSVTPDPLALMRRAFEACKPGGSVWILNHFSQSSLWSFLERPLRSFAGSLGFRTDFPYQRYVTDQNWKIVAEYRVNLFALSRLIHVRNKP